MPAPLIPLGLGAIAALYGDDASAFFLGEDSKYADKDKLAKAKELAKGGMSNRDVLRETGWYDDQRESEYLGNNPLWKFETDDRGLSKNVPPHDQLPGQGGPEDMAMRATQHNIQQAAPGNKRTYSSMEKLLMRVAYPNASKEEIDRMYDMTGGQAEARNVFRRKNLTPYERRNIPPWETEDVPRSEQLDMFDIINGKIPR